MKICLSCEGIAAVEQTTCGSCGTPLLDRDAVHYPQRRGEADTGNPLLGTVLDGKYRLTSVLGRGGMGVVFRAVHEVSLVPLAVKLLHPRYSQRPEYRRALIVEARQAGRVVHEGVARILDVGETAEGSVYLAMELAAGETLDACVPAGKSLPPPAAVEVLVQICRALVAIHAAGLVHRDLSARNVMVATVDGRPVVKVLDFGIAKAASMLALAGRAPSSEETMARANPAFSAPEHIAGQDVDARADLYGLGVIAYLLLTGQLPVDSPDPREAARATLEGRLLPLPSVPGVPRRLARLIQRCLQRDPELRPETAAAVLGELEALRGEGRRLLPRLAVASSVVAAVLAALAFGVAREPYLALVPGGPLRSLDPGDLSASTPVLYLSPELLGTVVFTHGGFDPAMLRVEISRGGLPLSRYQLQPTVDGDKLVLATAQEGWRAAVAGIESSSEDGPVDLQISVPWRPPFGSVRVRLDAVPPVVSLRLPTPTDVLTAAVALDLQAEDHIGLAQCWLVARAGSALEVSMPIDPAQHPRITGEFLTALLPGVADQGPLSLRLVAEDHAGNRASSELQFGHADLAAPQITRVRSAGGDDVVPFLGSEASVEITWSAPETDVTVAVAGDHGPELQLRFSAAGADGVGRGVLRSPVQAADAFTSGVYTFAVKDAVGNLARSKIHLQFRSRRLDPRLEVVNDEVPTARAEIIGDELVLDGGPVTLRFACNDSFAVASADVLKVDGAPQSVRLSFAGPGACRLQLPALPVGSHRLQLYLEPVGEGQPEVKLQAYVVRVLPTPVVVRVDDSGHRFLQQLLAHDVFVQQKDGQLRDGAAFRVEPWLRPLLRGRVWIGGGPWTPLPLLDPVAADSHLLPPIQPSIGRNVLALDLLDALGRPVQVDCGDAPAPRQRIDDRELPVVATFYHDPDGPGLVGEEVSVEFGQAAVVVLRSRLPFQPADAAAIHLSFGSQSEVAASTVSARSDGGATLVFRLPFSTWSQAARLLAPSESTSSVNDLPRADYARGLSARLDASLDTPNGPYLLHLQLRTARTTLRAVPLGDLRPAGALPPEVAGIVLVPVLAPEPPVLKDPVAENAPGRALFRARPHGDVGNLQDCLLQDREVTRAQYLAVLDAFFALPLRGQQHLWHADDPLGALRLARQQLLPAGFDAAADTALLLGGAGDAAITGLDFYQASCWCRLLSMLVGDDPELLRLPLGCELELAAFGSGDPRGARNAAAARAAPVRMQGFLACQQWWDGHRAPPSAADCLAAGDAVKTEFDRAILGLDFGVREWVADLPRGDEAEVAALLREWTSDHELHLRHVRQLARAGSKGDVVLPMRDFGVVRGLAFGELDGLCDPATGARFEPTATAVVPAAVPGVVRCEQLRRDGRDLLPGQRNPILLRTGFRTAGDARFAELVRRRGQ